VSRPTSSPFPAPIFWIGRKPLLRGGSTVMAISHLLTALLVCPPRMLLTIVPPFVDHRFSNSAANGRTIQSLLGLPLGMSSAPFSMCCKAHKVIFSGVYLFTVAYGVSFGPIGWVLPNEVFPLSMRGKGAALSTASNWSNNCTSRTHCLTSSFLADNDMRYAQS
jgi:Sugar (and other) transporter